MERTCKYCNEIFNEPNGKIFANHVKWCEKNPTGPVSINCKFCKEPINSLVLWKHEKACYLKPENIRRCVTCNIIIKTPENKYCSMTCAAKNTNEKRLDSDNPGYRTTGYVFAKLETICIACGSTFLWSKNLGRERLPERCDSCSKVTIGNRKKSSDRVSVVCIICNVKFDRYCWSPRKTCSEKCIKALFSKRSRENPNCGGETNFKKFIYNDIVMDSSWEVLVAQCLDELEINWIRSRKLCFIWKDSENNNHRYYPDFFLPEYNIYLDPKNKWKLEKDLPKLEAVVSQNNLRLIVGEVKRLINKIRDLKAGTLVISPTKELLIVDKTC